MDDEISQIVAEGADDAALTHLHPNHIKLLRIRAVLTSIPLVIGAIVTEATSVLPTGVVVGPVALAALILILRIPLRRHYARGYAMSDDRLRVVRGIWFRRDTVVPFGRVQHIDVDQSPLERYFGIATLTLHTAGTHNASVNLPGLENSLAMQMREEIRTYIKRESL